MERFALRYLQNWKSKANRKPLVIRGARQVGKTELVRIFAKQAFKNLVEINFDETPGKASLFQDEDVHNILRFIEIDADDRLEPGETLLFLDEIQAFPAIFSKLRYFYEKIPDLHVICAGSLLDFALSEPGFSVPVGRIEFLNLGPMSFEEFLIASGHEKLRDYLCSFVLSQSIPAAIHEQLLGTLREYSIVGGLPGVLKAYLKTGKNPQTLIQEQQGILQTYYLDFGKYKKRVNVASLQVIFKKIPTHIGTTIKYSALDPEQKSLHVKENLDLLEKARLIYRVFHSDANGMPLGSEVNERYFKLVFLDVGLLNTMLGIRETDLVLEKDIILIHSGAVAEQLVGQALLYSENSYAEPSLYYWNRPKRGSTAEVDYLIQSRGRIIPVEVKAGSTGRLKSLQTFIQEKKVPVGVRFNSDPPSVHETRTAVAGKEPRSFTLLSLPLYLAEQINRLLG
jgi:predicted AAA+ superfamily ATPase